MSTLLTAALAYAAHGIPVLPLHTPNPDPGCSCGRHDCDRAGKHPRWHRQLLRSGLHDASTQPAQIRRWWAHWPDANVGLRTGVALDVCDVDGDEGVDALHDLVGDIAGTCPLVRTGSGGWHLYLATTGIGNRVRFLPGVDWRGTDGYVVAPPSLHASGNHYQWIRPLTPEVPPCPNVLMARLEVRPAATASLNLQPVHNSTRYAAAALAGEAERVAGAPQGERNHTLYRAARNLGELVAGNVIAEHEAASVLTDAAHRAGLGTVETARTIRSGFNAGRSRPRRAA